jgi:cytochrome P450
MRWIILLMANYIDIQIKISKEVEDIIGDCVATHEDKQKYHYVNAFIAECLRFKIVLPLAVPLTALCDTRIGQRFDV